MSFFRNTPFADRLYIGNLFYTGELMPKDYEKAFEYNMKAAEKDYPDAEFNLSQMLFKGEGAEKNDQEALKWLKRASDHGLPIAQVNLAACYISGKILEKNIDIGIKLLEEASEKNETAALVRLGKIYYDGLYHREQNLALAAKYFKKAAKSDSPEALYYLGNMFYEGKGMSQDYKKAFICYSRSVEHNYLPAQVPLAVCYILGNGVEKNIDLGVKLLEDSVASGSADAALRLGIIYYMGLYNQKQDFPLALKYFKKAATQNLPDALYKLGTMFYKGEGVKQDYKKAFEYYSNAIKNGNREAEIYTGIMYYQGYGVNQNIPEALKIFDDVYKRNDLALIYKMAKEMAENGIALDKAEKYIQNVLSKNTENYEFIDILGYIYYKQKRYADATKEFEKAIRLKPDNAKILKHYGDTCLAAGLIDKAKEQWTLALKNVSDDDDLLKELKKSLDNASTLNKTN